MNGIKEILESGRFPVLMIGTGKTEQRKLEDESARNLLKGCRQLEEKDGTFLAGSGVSKEIVKETWEFELGDQRKNSITERYDDRMARVEEAADKMGLT